MTTNPLAAAEIVKACLESENETPWTTFVQYFQPLIASSVSRVLRRYGHANPSLADDLIQETYLRLCRDNCRVLRDFQAKHDEAIFGYIKVIATSVALDHFRARATHKRRGEVEDDGTNLEGSTASSTIEQSLLLKELDRRLASTENERDRTIFWLYYRQGYTARDIAAVPQFRLTQKGVESCIYRLTQSLRDAVSSKGPGFTKGLPPQNTLGVMK
ncbi:RNA polymerase sigma-70 factor (ECF subfamily) [Edaphobacter aggregans]|uniref:RNA polymerase sigma-70 factor (ECF subfamily) n=1 Tax=Edaphobacter aggregans TaxID=570835 RepID=A0A3R9QJJ1_9BACT|nr:sigma-70 family RNA polymerase sigma factor [Edaphobacter aggregans]RSL18010.1 RNA polymerase sigma-70 factor (ECF subfamily) [Edaphobacter aggregans]